MKQFMDTIVLSGKKELDIYVNPQRQNLLRHMRIAGVPVTPKQLADRMGISASAVQHHIRQLAELGVVELHHTERIHGITASFYHVPSKTVCIGSLLNDELKDQRLALMQADLSRTFSGFTAYCSQNTADSIQNRQFGDMLSGVVHLEEAEAKELYDMIRAFLAKHAQTGKSGAAWEYALIAYPVTGADHA